MHENIGYSIYLDREALCGTYHKSLQTLSIQERFGVNTDRSG